jgi:hypothetical protein
MRSKLSRARQRLKGVRAVAGLNSAARGNPFANLASLAAASPAVGALEDANVYSRAADFPDGEAEAVVLSPLPAVREDSVDDGSERGEEEAPLEAPVGDAFVEPFSWASNSHSAGSDLCEGPTSQRLERRVPGRIVPVDLSPDEGFHDGFTPPRPGSRPATGTLCVSSFSPALSASLQRVGFFSDSGSEDEEVGVGAMVHVRVHQGSPDVPAGSPSPSKRVRGGAGAAGAASPSAAAAPIPTPTRGGSSQRPHAKVTPSPMAGAGGASEAGVPTLPALVSPLRPPGASGSAAVAAAASPTSVTVMSPSARRRSTSEAFVGFRSPAPEAPTDRPGPVSPQSSGGIIKRVLGRVVSLVNRSEGSSSPIPDDAAAAAAAAAASVSSPRGLLSPGRLLVSPLANQSPAVPGNVVVVPGSPKRSPSRARSLAATVDSRLLPAPTTTSAAGRRMFSFPSSQDEDAIKPGTATTPQSGMSRLLSPSSRRRQMGSGGSLSPLAAGVAAPSAGIGSGLTSPKVPSTPKVLAWVVEEPVEERLGAVSEGEGAEAAPAPAGTAGGEEAADAGGPLGGEEAADAGGPLGEDKGEAVGQPPVGGPTSLFALVNSAHDHAKATSILLQERPALTKWSLVTLLAVSQAVFGLALTALGAFFLLTGFTDGVAITVVLLCGIAVLASAAVSLMYTRGGRHGRGLMGCLLSLGFELVCLGILGLLRLQASGNVIRLILLAHAGTITTVVVVSAWMVRAARRAEAQLVLDLTLMMRLQQDRVARPSFVAVGPMASQRIARVFR